MEQEKTIISELDPNGSTIQEAVERGYIHHLIYGDGLIYSPFDPSIGHELGKVKKDMYVDIIAEINVYLCELSNGLKGYILIPWFDLQITDY